MGNTATMHNGVNAEELGALVSRVKANPALGKFQFRSKARWINRAHSQSTFDSLYGVGVNHKRATPSSRSATNPRRSSEPIWRPTRAKQRCMRSAPA